MEQTFEKLYVEHAEFSDKTFGKSRSFYGPLQHLQKEVKELLENPSDDHEYADCLLLLIDAYRRKGGTAHRLLNACFEKLEINKERKWPDQPDENGVFEHVKS